MGHYSEITYCLSVLDEIKLSKIVQNGPIMINNPRMLIKD